MKMVLPLLLSALAGAGPAAAQPEPQRRGDQTEALKDRREGRILSIAEIERRIVPGMRGAQYLGFVYDSAGAVYTLKFLRDGSVIWVMVDGRSGVVLGRAG